MSYAIFKASWNPALSQNVQGGICGTAFFIDQQTALTAHHVLNSATFRIPTIGFSDCRYWLLNRNGTIVECNSVTLVDHPEVDLTVIKFASAIPNVTTLCLSAEQVPPDSAVSNQGYVAGSTGDSQLQWVNANLTFRIFDLRSSFNDGDGVVAECSIANFATQDINLNDIKVLKLSYGGLEGMSGGPLVVQGTTRVVGLMSYGLPPDVPQKHALFAVAAEEIIIRL